MEYLIGAGGVLAVLAAAVGVLRLAADGLSESEADHSAERYAINDGQIARIKHH